MVPWQVSLSDFQHPGWISSFDFFKKSDEIWLFWWKKNQKNQNIKCHFGDCLGEVSPKVSPASFESVTKSSPNFTHKWQFQKYVFIVPFVL